MEAELKAFGNKLVEAHNRGGKEGLDEMLKRDGWRVGGGFFTQMHDGHPVQTIPIAQMRHYVSGLVDPQTHEPVSDIGSAIGAPHRQAVGATQGRIGSAQGASRSENRLFSF